MIETVHWSAHEYVDFNVSVNEQNYYYRIEAINVCDIQTVNSNSGSSILLDAELVEDLYILNWTSYEEWDPGVNYYLIEKLNKTGTWEIIKAVNGNTTHFEGE